jgi:hypothetical protein
LPTSANLQSLGGPSDVRRTTRPAGSRSTAARPRTRIKNNERNDLRDYWEFGREVVKLRNGMKKLRNRLLQEIATQVGRSPSDIGNRRRFAERYPDLEAFANAVREFGSWHNLVNGGGLRKGNTTAQSDTTNTNEPHDGTQDQASEQVPPPDTRAARLLTRLDNLHPDGRGVLRTNWPTAGADGGRRWTTAKAAVDRFTDIE